MSEPPQVPDESKPIEPGISAEEISARDAAWLVTPREPLKPFSATHQRPPLPD
jgi:hypothetical protein